MQALVTRRAKAPSGSSDEGSSPRVGDADALLHKGGPSSAPALAVASATPAAGAAAGAGRRLHWALYLLALLAGFGLLLHAVDRPDHTHQSFVKVHGTQVRAGGRPAHAHPRVASCPFGGIWLCVHVRQSEGGACLPCLPVCHLPRALDTRSACRLHIRFVLPLLLVPAHLPLMLLAI